MCSRATFCPGEARGYIRAKCARARFPVNKLFLNYRNSATCAKEEALKFIIVNLIGKILCPLKTRAYVRAHARERSEYDDVSL